MKSLLLGLLLLPAIADAQATKDSSYVQCMAWMETGARGALNVSMGAQPPANYTKALDEVSKCATRARDEIKDEGQKRLFVRAYQLYVVSLETPSVTAMSELTVAAADFNQTLR